MLGAGADVSGRPSLRRTGRLGGLIAITLSFVALVHDLGRPARFVNMLRVAKPTSPMSVGTWILSLYGPAAGLAGAAELPFLPRFVRRLLRPFVRPAGLGAAAVAPAVATYTGVLLAHTATPAWNSARHELPIVFAGSAAAASGGLGLVFASVDDAGPARRFAVAGAVARAGRREAHGAVDGAAGRDTAPRAGRRADACQPDADRRRRARRARRPPQPRRVRAVAVPRCWPVRSAPGSASSRPARRPPRIRSTPSCRSASASPLVSRPEPPQAGCVAAAPSRTGNRA